MLQWLWSVYQAGLVEQVWMQCGQHWLGALLIGGSSILRVKKIHCQPAVCVGAALGAGLYVADHALGRVLGATSQQRRRCAWQRGRINTVCTDPGSMTRPTPRFAGRWFVNLRVNYKHLGY